VASLYQVPEAVDLENPLMPSVDPWNARLSKHSATMPEVWRSQSRLASFTSNKMSD
jgi:hypothetical protein